MHKRGRFALTLIELLVVIVIVAGLVALMLPAVFSAREAARMTACRSHMAQFGKAVHSHLIAQGHFPTGGWGYAWVGDPDRGFDKRQPGGWVFNLLPYLDASGLWALGKGVSGEQKLHDFGLRLQTSLSVMRCPSRGGPPLSRYESDLLPKNSAPVDLVSKADYAMNAGDFGDPSARLSGGPESLEQADNGIFTWPSGYDLATGISYARSMVLPRNVVDGSSTTYLIGEKYVFTLPYPDAGHDQSMFSGHDFDVVRWAMLGATPQRNGKDSRYWSFGSAHAPGCLFVLCDGSVRLVSYDIDAEVHRRYGNRHDGLPMLTDRPGS